MEIIAHPHFLKYRLLKLMFAMLFLCGISAPCRAQSLTLECGDSVYHTSSAYFNLSQGFFHGDTLQLRVDGMTGGSLALMILPAAGVTIYENTATDHFLIRRVGLLRIQRTISPGTRIFVTWTDQNARVTRFRATITP